MKEIILNPNGKTFKRPQPLMAEIIRIGFLVRGGADYDSTDEKNEALADRLLAEETDRIRLDAQLNLYGKSDEELEADAAAFLAANGFNELGEEIKK